MLLKLSHQISQISGRMKKISRDMSPSIKLFEISHFHLEIHANLYSILYIQRGITCEGDRDQTLTHMALEALRGISYPCEMCTSEILTTAA